VTTASKAALEALEDEAKSCALEFYAAEIRHQSGLNRRYRGARLRLLEGRKAAAEAAVELARLAWATGLGVSIEELPE
jgi:hypothetical protein